MRCYGSNYLRVQPSVRCWSSSSKSSKRTLSMVLGRQQQFARWYWGRLFLCIQSNAQLYRPRPSKKSSLGLDLRFVFPPLDTPPTNQVVGFIDQVIGEPAFVAGNSLGGFIGAHVAATHPRAVRGLALMNATPFWAFRKPSVKRSSAAANKKAADGGRRDSQTEGGGSGDWLGWDGVLPAPEGLFRFGAWYFDRMRDPRTVKTMLSAVYSNAGEALFFASRNPGRTACWLFGPSLPFLRDFFVIVHCRKRRQIAGLGVVYILPFLCDTWSNCLTSQSQRSRITCFSCGWLPIFWGPGGSSPPSPHASTFKLTTVAGRAHPDGPERMHAHSQGDPFLS